MTERKNTAESEIDARRLDRWKAHLAARRSTLPDTEDFRSFGRLSSLERLRNVLSRMAPEQCGPLARVISELKREKRLRAGSRGKGGRPGVDRKLSVGVEDLPRDWRKSIEEMRRRRGALDAGMIDIGDVAPLALSQIRAIEYLLRCIVKICGDEGRAIDVDADSVRAWVERQEGRGQGETGLSMQLRKLGDFLAYRGEKKKLRKKIVAEASRYGRIGRLKRKRKDSWLIANPTDIGKVWDLAEQLLAESRGAKAGTSKRYLLALHALALALAVAAPLRIGDLSRLRIGHEIRRDATGWSMAMVTQKTKGDYERPELWPDTNGIIR